MKDKEISFIKKKVKYNNNEIVVFLLLLAIAVTAFSIGITNYVDFNSSTINLGNRNLVTNGDIRIRGKLLVGTGTVEITGDGMGVVGGVRVEKGSIVTEKGTPVNFPETVALTGDLRFSQGNHYVGLDAPSNLSETQIYKLPLTDGTDGQFLKTDGSGNLSFITPDGDISSVTAGTGLSGGGDSGDITLSIDSTVATLAGSQILTNKNISLENNTLTGTTAEFNTALSDGSFATLNGLETLTNKTLNYSTLNGSVNGTAILQDNNFSNVTNDTLATSESIKAYVDSVAAGLDLKESCRAATTGPLPTNTYNNGTSGVGATLTGNLNGALTAQDDVTLVQTNRLLVKNESSAANNGIYIVTTVGDGSNPYVLTRANDFDGTPVSEIPGGFTFIEEGTVNGDDGFVCTTDSPVIVGTTAINFTQFSAGGGGDVTAANNFATNNLLIRSDGTGKGIKNSSVTVDDTSLSVPSSFEFLLNDSANNKIYSDGTDVHIDSGGGDIHMDLGSNGGDIILPQDTGIQFGSNGRIIETDNGSIHNLLISANTDILIDGGTNGTWIFNGKFRVGTGNNAAYITRTSNDQTSPLTISQVSEIQLSKYVASMKVVDTFAPRFDDHRLIIESENGTNSETVQIKAPAGGILISSATTTAGIIKIKPGEGGLITNRGVQTITDSATDPTAAHYVAGFIECTGGGPDTWTLPTGPALADAMPGAAPTKGDSFICHVVNSSSFSITYEGATGATLSSSGAGSLVQKAGSIAQLQFIFTDVTGGSEAYFCLLIADNS